MKRILGLRQHVDSLEQMNRRMAEQVEAFHETQTAPPPESEGAILVQTADHKSGPLYAGNRWRVKKKNKS